VIARFSRRFMNNRTRIVLLGLFAVLVAVWGSSASLPLARSDDRADRRAADREGQPAPALFDVDEAAARLRSRQRESPAPRDGGRNPFEFARPAVTAASVIAAPASAITPPAPPAEPPAPLFTLSGIVDKTVENRVSEGGTGEGGAGQKTTVRTAVISGLGQLYFAKVGDPVTTRYTVAAIGADAVELRDVVTGQSIRLALQ
jgi:hypothetical protein